MIAFHRVFLSVPSMTMLAITSILSFRTARGFSPRLRFGVVNPRSSSFHLRHQSNIHHGNCCTLYSTTPVGRNEQATSENSSSSKSAVPMTLLAGFLGSGKTTTLQNLLSNNDGLKIGIIVNDVASINIDSKLLANPNLSDTSSLSGGGDSSENADEDASQQTIELQNGCACCTLADELLDSVEQITDQGKRNLDAIVIELSGVADPNNIKFNWEQATENEHPATQFAQMDKVVTLVDSSTFGTDWMSWDSSGDRDGWVDNASECEAKRKVPELLAEQIEAADVLVMNKVDLAGEEQVRVATDLVKSLNDEARIFEVEFGNITAKEVLQDFKAEKGVEESSCCDDPGCADPDCSDEVTPVSSCCDDPGCDEATPASSCCDDPGCADPDCSDEVTSVSSCCDDPGCADPDCSDDATSVSSCCDDPGCADPNCSDETTSHDHQSTSTANLGITNFVYKAKKPFHQSRLMAILNAWPVPIKNDLNFTEITSAAIDGFSIEGKEQKSVFIGVLRSKGFCWMAPSQWTGARDDVWRHDTSMYWSHAGKHFSVSTAGKWWGALTKEHLKGYFTTNMKEYQRILDEDFVSDEFGDRRQEIVFIGVKMDEEEITKELDECLLSDEEMALYRMNLRNFEQTTFTVSADGGGPSLFDVGGTDHMDEGAGAGIKNY